MRACNIVNTPSNVLTKHRIAEHLALNRILSNISWLILDKIIRMALGIIVGIWMARYLGPDQFGQLNYVMAFVGLAYPIASLGLSSIVVRDILKAPASAHETMGSAFVLQILGGLTAIPIALLALHLIRGDNQALTVLAAIMSASLTFKAADLFKCWFESQVKSSHAVIAENIVFFLCSASRITLIVLQSPLTAFAWLFLAESALTALALAIVYWRDTRQMQAWRLSAQRMSALLKDSWPLFLSGLAIMVYMRIDQIMLGEMMGLDAVGIYSAATKLSEVWYFLPSAIAASIYPSIMEAKKTSETLYLEKLQQLFKLVVWIALLLALPATLFSSFIIDTIYGPQFQSAGTVFAIHIWTAPFVFLGVASNIWYVTENLQHLALFRTLAGALINIIANYFLIAKFGPEGAALGTLLAQSFAAYGFDAFNKKTRHIFKMKSMAFTLPKRLSI